MPLKFTDTTGLQMTLAERKARTVALLNVMLDQTSTLLKDKLLEGCELYYANPFGLTREQVREALGSGVAKFDRLVEIMKGTIEEAEPGAVQVLMADFMKRLAERAKAADKKQ